MDNSKQIIFADKTTTIWPYAYKTPDDDELIYTRITSVHILNDLIYFTAENWTKSYAKTTNEVFYAEATLISLHEYRNNLYELYEANSLDAEYPPGHIRLDIYKLLIKKYTTVAHPIPRKPIKEIIQDTIITLVDPNDIIHATVIYDCQWPNYTINRNAYYDIILETIE